MAPSTTARPARPARWPRARNASRATASVFAFRFSLSAFASRPPRRAAAFTLVECLVAGTVLALFGASIAVAATQAGAANRRGDQRREAARHLDAVLTKIDLLGPGRLAVEGPLGGSLGGGDFAAAGLRDAAWSAAIALEGTWPDLYAVAVTISWTDSAGKPRAVTGHTRLYDPVGSRTVRVGWDEL